MESLNLIKNDGKSCINAAFDSQNKEVVFMLKNKFSFLDKTVKNADISMKFISMKLDG